MRILKSLRISDGQNQNYSKKEGKMKKFNVTVNGVNYDVEVEEVRGGVTRSMPRQASAPVQAAPAPVQAAPAPAQPTPSPAVAGESITSPMPGNILKVLVKVGDSVKRGQVLLILEAMKMENEIVASTDGTVRAVSVVEGNTVDTGASLVVIG